MTGVRVLAAIGAAVPVRLMKRDLLFVIEKLVSLMDEPRLEMLARHHAIRQKRDDGGIGKTFAACIRRADEGALSRLLVETGILLAASRSNAAAVLRDAAAAYKVDTDCCYFPNVRLILLCYKLDTSGLIRLAEKIVG